MFNQKVHCDLKYVNTWYYTQQQEFFFLRNFKNLSRDSDAIIKNNLPRKVSKAQNHDRIIHAQGQDKALDAIKGINQLHLIQPSLKYYS